MTQQLRVAIGGLGAIGMAVAQRLDQGLDGLRLTAVSARDRDAALDRIADFRQPVPVLALEELAAVADVVVECAPAVVFEAIGKTAVSAGRVFMPLSVGALLAHWHLVDLAQQTGARIIAPSGALLGLDAVRAAAQGRIHEVRMVTRKPPAGLVGAPHLVAHDIDISSLSEPVNVFSGTAREAALGFPANANVAAALALAGIGPDRTQVEIWADPTVTRNTHQVMVDAESARFELRMESIPSDNNPRTGRIVPLSVISALRTLVSPITVGV